MARILIAGEALIDCIPTADDTFRPVVGGSPFNVAIACARLASRKDLRIGFMGGVSTDFFGDRLMRALHTESIDTTWVARLDAPTTLAFVDLSEENPRYAFYDERSATRTFTAEKMKIAEATQFVHVGSVSLIGPPGADELARIATEAAQAGRIVSLDPNVRPSLVHDDQRWRARLDALMAVATIIKLSDEDLAALNSGMTAATFAVHALRHGVALVIVTGGSSGATAWTPSGYTHVAAPRVSVIDTIGAGDTLMAALLISLAERHLDTPHAIAALDTAALTDLLGFATRAAAITCTRAGCNPPYRAEVDRHPSYSFVTD